MVDVKIKGIQESNFEARVRYLGSTLIITVPSKVRKELVMKPGDRVKVNIRKE